MEDFSLSELILLAIVAILICWHGQNPPRHAG